MYIKKQAVEKKNIYIYGFGSAGRWFSEQIDAVNFIDTDIKKRGMAHNGIKVLDIQQALSKIKPTDIIVVTVVDIQDIVKIIKSTFNNKCTFLNLLTKIN